jgi:lipoprotein-anchoring transpeptidase ErfK/SrfK
MAVVAANPTHPASPEKTPAAPDPASRTKSDTAGADEPAAMPVDFKLDFYPRPVHDWLEVQIALARRGFSSGSIDGVRGPQSAAALRAFQRNAAISDTGELDPDTAGALLITEPALASRALSTEDLESLQPVSDTWLGKSQQTALAHATALELVAERYHASPKFLQKLNPAVNWTAVTTGTPLIVPAVEHVEISGKAMQLHVSLGGHEIEATDADGNVIAHFPVSIARDVEKRPVGELAVTVVIPDPNYTFDPVTFPESPEAKELGRKLIIPPGPNNPVGLAWIGLNRVGYGIHGTPDPEKVGRTESHGCFRVANWDAVTLLGLVWVGLPVEVEP